MPGSHDADLAGGPRRAPTTPPSPAPARVPGTLRTAVVLVLIEAVALVLAAFGWLVQVATGASEGTSVAWFLLVFVLGVAAVLGLAAQALRRGSRGGRGPVLTWQLLQAVTAVTVLRSGPAPEVAVVALLALAVGACVAALVLSRSALAATAPR